MTRRLPTLSLASTLAVLLTACGGSGGGGTSVDARLAPPPAFQTRVAIDAGVRGLTSAIAADWTGDGVADILVSAAIDREIRLLVATRPGSFSTTAGPRLSFDDDPFDLVAGDFDADGDLDFACLFRKVGRIRVFANDGVGRFEQTEDLATSAQPRALFAADIDGDADVDLVSAGAARIDVWSSTNRRFARSGSIDLGTGSQISSVWVGQLDRDSYLDLAVSETSKNEVFVWRGSATGFDAPKRLLLSLPGKEPVHVLGGDATGDGIPDLTVALYGSRQLAVFAGNGSGNYQPATTIDVGGAPFDVRLARLDGFDQDQLVVSYLDRAAVAIVEARSGGAFGPERQFGTSGRPTRSQIVDLDADGRADVLATSLDGAQLSVLYGTSGGLDASEDFELGTTEPEHVLAADFDGDGIDDALVSDPDSDRCHVLVGQARKPRERMRRVASLEVGAAPTSLDVGDFDRDGRPDVVVATADGLRILWNRSDSNGPAFVVWPSTAQAAVPVGRAPFEVAVGRYDGDANDDVAVVAAADDRLTILFGAASGLGFRDLRNEVVLGGGSPTSPVACDVDGDGRLDLSVAARDAGVVRVFTGDGTGGFTARIDLAAARGVDALRATDLDGDGDFEVVGTASSRDELWIVEDDAGALRMANLVLGVMPSAVHSADVNGDGRADLLIADGKTGEMRVFLGNGSGGFVSSAPIPAVFRAVSMSSGDFDGDGRFDLLVASQLTDRVTLIRSLR